MARVEAKKRFEAKGWWHSAMQELAPTGSSSKPKRETKEELDPDETEFEESTEEGKASSCTKSYNGDSSLASTSSSLSRINHGMGARKLQILDAPLGQLELHRNYNFWNNTPGIYIQRALYALEEVAFSPMNIKSLLAKGQREIPKGELFKLLEAAGECDPEQDFDDERNLEQLVHPTTQVNLASGRPFF